MEYVPKILCKSSVLKIREGLMLCCSLTGDHVVEWWPKRRGLREVVDNRPEIKVLAGIDFSTDLRNREMDNADRQGMVYV